jgi:hypothetical protein
LCKQVVAHPASSTDSLTPTHYTTTRQSADLHHTARQASDEGHQIRFLEFGSGRVSSGGSGGCLTENLAW